MAPIMILMIPVVIFMSIALLINSICGLFGKYDNFNNVEVTEEYTEFIGTFRNRRRTISYNGERERNYISHHRKYLP
jgi:cellobiose-specific phosphotransferase system component IIC